MKKLILLFAATFATLAASAQIREGVVMVGGTVGLNHYSSGGSSQFNLSISPMAAFFLSDRFAAGGTVGLGLSTGDSGTLMSIGLAPLARYYFTESGQMRFFGQLRGGFYLVGSEVFENSTTILTLGAGVGADYFLNDRVAIEGLLGYDYTDNGDAFGSSNNNIGLNFGIVAFIGGGSE